MRTKWIPVTEQLPKSEKVVEITCERPAFEEKRVFVTHAFYENGLLTTKDSAFRWEGEPCYWEYDRQKDAYIIPTSWWKCDHPDEGAEFLDAKVLAWRPLPKPYNPADN